MAFSSLSCASTKRRESRFSAALVSGGYTGPVGGLCGVKKRRWLYLPIVVRCGVTKHIALCVSLGDAFASDVEILGVELDPHKATAHAGTSYAGCSASHEWIKDGFAGIGEVGQQFRHQRDGL